MPFLDCRLINREGTDAILKVKEHAGMLFFTDCNADNIKTVNEYDVELVKRRYQSKELRQSNDLEF